jgi:hypothetical protein
MKQCAAFSLAVAGLFAITSRGAAPVDGLVLNYKFSGDASDSGPLQNHAQAFGAVLTADRFGQADSAYQLNGTGAFIEAAAALPEMASATVSLWLRLDSWVQLQNWGAPQVVFFEGDDGPGHDFALYVLGGFHFITKGGSQLDYNNWLPTVGTWTHLVCVDDAVSAKMAMWVNGKKVAEGPSMGSSNVGFHAAFNLGRRPGGYNDWFVAAAIDDVRVYDRALTDSEIDQLNTAEVGSTRSLQISIETLRLTMSLEPGRRYILQSSVDLEAWTDFGSAFVATASSHVVSVTPQDSACFWRVLERP